MQQFPSYIIGTKELLGLYRINEVRGVLNIEPFYLLIVYWYLKTFIIMANVEIKFIDCHVDDDSISVKSLKDLQFEVGEFIQIKGISFGDEFWVNLDKATAIKFAKTLRTEINKIQD